MLSDPSPAPPGSASLPTAIHTWQPLVHPTIHRLVSELIQDSLRAADLDNSGETWVLPPAKTTAHAVPSPSLASAPSGADVERSASFTKVGPHAAAGLRSLQLSPLLADRKLNASQLPVPLEAHVDDVITRYSKWRAQSQVPNDSPFDTTGDPEQPSDGLTRKVADREVVKSRDDCRRLKAWLSFVVRSNGRLTWDVFTPSVQLWQAFANDCSSKSKPIQALSDYATLLTKFTAQLAVQLGTSHPLYTALIANEGKPWHDAKFARIAASYKDARAAVRNASAAKAATSADPAKTSPVLEQAALPVPAYQLDIWLASAKTAMADHTSSTLTLQGVRQALAALPPPPPAPRRSSERSNSMAAAKRRKLTDPFSDERIKLVSQIRDLEHEIHMSGRLIGGYAVSFAQFIFMMRASSAAGGLEFGGPGIAGDLKFTDLGLTYVIRFMKNWKASDSLHGERLPLPFQGANTIPMGTSPIVSGADARPSHERELMLTTIKYAMEHKNPGSDRALISFIDSNRPEKDGAARINKHLDNIGATAQLRPSDRIKMGRTQSISSHSIRKAAISMALASGVSAQNIRRWTRWFDVNMVWHYAQADYVVPEQWKSFFHWMTKLPAQHA